MAAEDLDGSGLGGRGQAGEGEGEEGKEELHVGVWLVFVPLDVAKRGMGGLLVREGTRLDWRPDSNDSNGSLAGRTSSILYLSPCPFYLSSLWAIAR